MTSAIDELINEHRLIEDALSSFETFLGLLGKRPESERAAIRRYAHYFHQLVDVCHHGKEENYLFVKMADYGFKKDGGPISAMLSEQDEGRDHLDALTEIGKSGGPLSERERELVRGHALGYILRIRPHMAREEDILFPIVLHSLPRFVLEEIAKDFGEFEKCILPSGFHHDLNRIVRDLFAAYPPHQTSR